MQQAQDYYPDCPEALIVGLARSGDRDAFEELVRRRQSSIRNLMRRYCGDITLADDLAQQVFLKLWLNIRTLKQANAFHSWLKRMAINVWLQHLRKNDALRNADDLDETESGNTESKSMGLDLDNALATLPATVRLCIVLSYHDGMSHTQISELTQLPLGTVKSHINRGTKQLQILLAAYTELQEVEAS